MARVLCECGSDILSSYLKKHLQTQVHQRFVQANQRVAHIEPAASLVGRPRRVNRQTEVAIEVALDGVDMNEQLQMLEFYEKQKRDRERIEDPSHDDREERRQRLQRVRNMKEFAVEQSRIRRNQQKRERELQRLEEERLYLDQERQERIRIELRIELKRQERIKRKRQEEEKVEQERVIKRGIPKHIVAIVINESKEASCHICFDELTIENAFMTKCGHMMCKSCERKLFEQQNNQCPTCRHDF